jgi:NADH-quinone oxidoreductase subunit M
MENYLLSILIATPLIGAIVVLILPKNEKISRMAGLIFSSLAFIISFILYLRFDDTIADFQFIHKFQWIENLNIHYNVGVDGMSLLLVLLTTFITVLTFLSSWSSITKKVKEFTFFMLLLEVGMLGVFASLDLFLFYIFWEAMLIPMYFIIGLWGGENRIYATVKFFIYTMFGSLLMLVAIIWLSCLCIRTSWSIYN